MWDRVKLLSTFVALLSVGVAAWAASAKLGQDKLVSVLMLAAAASGLGAGVRLLASRKEPKSEQGRVFLIYAQEDRGTVDNLYEKLKAAGFKPWMDRQDLVPGQRWKEEIKKAIQQSDVALACLSQTAVSKPGFVQKELAMALDLMREKKEGHSPVIPLRLEETEVPERLRHLHWIDLFDAQGFERLQKSLRLAVGYD